IALRTISASQRENINSLLSQSDSGLASHRGGKALDFCPTIYARQAPRGDLRFGAPLSAITAVVVGLIASLAVFFAGPVLWPAGSINPWALLVVAAALFAQLRLRWSVLKVIGTAALVGAAWAGLVQVMG
ncbi:hypothetical protein KQ310_10700, partial [Synechococcus sp. CS-1328]|nr:hypothetical protein [Synechococcus sp. CS-1328]